jgi:hypothetical protein
MTPELREGIFQINPDELGINQVITLIIIFKLNSLIVV